MKRTVFILIGMALCLVLADKVQAQRCLPGMKGLRLTAGMADGFHSASRRNELGYHFGLSIDSYTKGCSRWVFGAEYLQKYHPYKDTRLPVSQFTAEGGYYYNFLSDANKVFLCYVGGSAMAGYETVNWGESLLPDGSRLTDEDNFIYGGALTLELSAYVTDKIVLLVNGRQRVLFGGDCGKFHTQVGVGIRFMIR